MPAVTISRGGGWADRFRRYDVVIDGEHRGTIGSREALSFELSPGSHRVRLRAGIGGASPDLRIHVDARGVALSCGPDKRLASFLPQTGEGGSGIWLRRDPT